MADRKTDRRVNRTCRLLRESLMDLIVEKGYDAVTIEDITERAELGRTTFYLHYRDKEELLLESIDAIADELTEKIYVEILSDNENQIDLDHPKRFRPVIFVFRHANENRRLYQIIFRGEGTTAAATRIRKIIFDAAKTFFNLQVDRSIRNKLSEAQVEIIAAYFSSALMGFLTWWLETGSSYSPEEMGEYFRVFFFDGVRSYIRQSNQAALA